MKTPRTSFECKIKKKKLSIKTNFKVVITNLYIQQPTSQKHVQSQQNDIEITFK